MEDLPFSGLVLARPTSLGSDGKSFTDNWGANGTYQNC